jgi:hypothetical protein
MIRRQQLMRPGIPRPLALIGNLARFVMKLVAVLIRIHRHSHSDLAEVGNASGRLALVPGRVEPRRQQARPVPILQQRANAMKLAAEDAAG